MKLLSGKLFLWLALAANIALFIIHLVGSNGFLELFFLLISSVSIITVITITYQQEKQILLEKQNKKAKVQALLNEQSQLMDESISESSIEFGVLIDQLTQVQEIIDSAIHKLSSSLFLIRKNRQPKYIPLKISPTNCRLKSLKGFLDHEPREILLILDKVSVSIKPLRLSFKGFSVFG